jgi:hypothetical protein
MAVPALAASGAFGTSRKHLRNSSTVTVVIATLLALGFPRTARAAPTSSGFLTGLASRASLKRSRGIRTASKASLHQASLSVRLPLGAVVFFVVVVERANTGKIVLGLSWRRLEVRLTLIELGDLPVLDFLTRLYSRRSGVVVPGHAGLLVLGE